MHLRSAFVTVLFVAAGGLLAVPPAWADPENSKNAFIVDLVCDDGNTYHVVAAGGQNVEKQIFSPAHDLDGTTTFVPTSFDSFSGTLRNSSGAVVFSFTDPAVPKGAAQVPKNRTPFQCTFAVSETFTVGPGDDPDLPPGTYTFSGVGEVSGFTTGKP